MHDENSNGWPEWRRHVLIELERLNEKLTRQDSKINRLCSDVSALKVKATAWGFVGGAVSVAVLLAVQLFRSL